MLWFAQDATGVEGFDPSIGGLLPRNRTSEFLGGPVYSPIKVLAVVSEFTNMESRT